MEKLEHEKNLYLVFDLTKEGLYIVGDRNGLKKLAEILDEMAEADCSDHAHLAIDLQEEMRQGNFIIDYSLVSGEKINLDVTILNSNRPKKGP